MAATASTVRRIVFVGRRPPTRAISSKIEASSSGAVVLDAEDVSALADGLATLDVRMQRHFDHARALAEYLRCHPQVGRVGYPGLLTHPDGGVAATVLEHGFGPAIDFCLTGDARVPAHERHEAFLATCAVAHRDAPAGGATTRMSVVSRRDVSYLRIFAGTDDPLYVADSLDQALRLFCNPPEPL